MRSALDGRIWSAGFASGDRFVVGQWDSGPIGAMTDVMWADPDGRRSLLAPDDRVAEFVASIYRFEAVRVVPFLVEADVTRLDLEAGPLRLLLLAGRSWPVFGPRPRWVTRWVEAPIARRALGVSTYGVSSGGRPEWYQARSLRWLHDGRARRAGDDLGALRPLDPPLRVGFSEPLRRPSVVRVRTILGPARGG